MYENLNRIRRTPAQRAFDKFLEFLWCCFLFGLFFSGLWFFYLR